MLRLLGLFVAMSFAFTAAQIPTPSEADATGGGGLYVPVAPSVLVDTTTGVGGSASPFTASQMRSYAAAGVGNVPSNASAILVNLAVLSTTGSDNYAQIGPDGVTLPGLGAIRYAPETAPRSTTAAVKLGANGKIQLTNKYGTTNFRVTVVGYFTGIGPSGPAPGGFVAVPPSRIVDTVSGAGVTIGQIDHGVTRTIQVAGGDIPSNATAVFASVTVSYINSDGDVRLYATGATMPSVSSLDYSLGGPEQNAIMVPLSADGRLNVTNMGPDNVHIQIDVQGFISSDPSEGGGFITMTTAALFQSGGGSSMLQPNETRDFVVGGINGVPPIIGGAMLTVIARGYTQDGIVELYGPTSVAPPGLGDLHFNNNDSGREVSSTTVVKPDGVGMLTVRNTSSSAVEVKINMQGWFSAPAETPDDDSSDPPLPAMTAYGVDESELEDLQASAADEGISLQSAVDKYGWQNNFSDDLETLPAEYPSSYSYSEMNPAGATTPSATVRFKGTVPAGVASRFSNLTVPVNLVGNAPYSANDMTALTSSISDSLAQQGGSDSQLSAYIDTDTWQAEATIYTPNGSAGAPGSSQRTIQVNNMRSNAQSAAHAEVPSVPTPTVNLTISDAPILTPTSLKGGVRISWSPRQSDGGWCTSGFPAVTTDTSPPIYGLLTARHCRNDTNFYSVGEKTNRLALKNAARFADTNAGDMQFHPTRGEFVAKSYYYKVGLQKRITSVGTVRRGDHVCLFGRASLGKWISPTDFVTHRTCSTVRRQGVEVVYPVVAGQRWRFKNLVEMNGGHLRGGDSGGPVFWGGRALGIVSGTYLDSAGNPTRGLFTSILATGGMHVKVNR